MNSKMKVLYIDDNEELLEIMKELVASSEVEVMTSANPQQSLDNIHKTEPDVIFVDYRMPKMTGVEFRMKLDKIQANVYLITGEIEPEDGGAFKKVITKPVKMKEIKELVEEELHKKKALVKLT